MGNANSWKAAGVGFGNSLGFGAVMPDPLADQKDQLGRQQQELTAYINQSNIKAMELFQKTEGASYQILQDYVDMQVANQQIVDEFLSERVDIQQVSFAIILLLIVIILIYIFVSK